MLNIHRPNTYQPRQDRVEASIYPHPGEGNSVYCSSGLKTAGFVAVTV